ncbi:Ribonuclease P protein subunit p30 [Porphyridium purpureum]|uniref:Ribonuclease P protein subunit p30 n=1 Tax=Porphyridium purpureum TaxID=35688 RepID=A0A5J4Z2E6_PORPP|nr:Ribonuclease P protein subunit p30 [Porphyridium purpureum]|eukprot:POR1176..scf295_1
MFHDLGVLESACAHVRPEEFLREVAGLGYDVIAIEQEVAGQPPKELQPSALVHRLREAQAAMSSRDSGQGHNVLRVTKRPAVTILSRLTIIANQPGELAHLAPFADRFDLLALRSSSEKVVQRAMQQDIDIVCLDVSQNRSPFRVKAPLLNVAIETGVVFELRYSNLLRTAALRKTFLAHAAELAETTKGKRVIITSGAANLLEMRGAYDAMNLCSLFGLDMHAARVCVTTNAVDCVSHGMVRSQTYKGAVAMTIELPVQTHDESKRDAMDLTN